MRGSLPRLMELEERFAGRADEFEVLAFHEASMTDFAELVPKLRALEREVWDGRRFPFPILLDSTGESQERYGVESFPTSVAIDPEGRVVRGDAANLLEEHLLTTSAEVRALRAALEQDLARGLERAAAARQDHAGHALLRYADVLDDPARQRDLARTLRDVGGPFATRYFTGQHGLASPDAGVRRFAVEALAEVAEPREYATLRTLELAAAAEPDPELQRALRELIARLAEG